MANLTDLAGPAAIDSLFSRNSTRISILYDGQRVGRVQSVRADMDNNVQVLAELGTAYMAELKKGITRYSFTIAKFYARSDVMDLLKLGRVFSLALHDSNLVSDGGSGRPQVLEYFSQCMMTSVSRDYTVGQATVGENASVVTIGKGVVAPAQL